MNALSFGIFLKLENILMMTSLIQTHFQKIKIIS